MDRAHVDQLALESRDELVALAYLLTGDHAQAQDIVQDVMVKLLRADLERVENLTAYARRAIVNEASSWKRRMLRTSMRTKALQAEWSRVLGTQPDPHDRIGVMGALQVLPIRQRTAIVLRYYLDSTDQDIGAAIGCAEGTVRSLLSRALKRLRDDLTNEEAES